MTALGKLRKSPRKHIYIHCLDVSMNMYLPEHDQTIFLVSFFCQIRALNKLKKMYPCKHNYIFTLLCCANIPTKTRSKNNKFSNFLFLPNDSPNNFKKIIPCNMQMCLQKNDQKMKTTSIYFETLFSSAKSYSLNNLTTSFLLAFFSTTVAKLSTSRCEGFNQCSCSG